MLTAMRMEHLSPLSPCRAASRSWAIIPGWTAWQRSLPGRYTKSGKLPAEQKKISNIWHAKAGQGFFLSLAFSFPFRDSFFLPPVRVRYVPPPAFRRGLRDTPFDNLPPIKADGAFATASASAILVGLFMPGRRFGSAPPSTGGGWRFDSAVRLQGRDGSNSHNETTLKMEKDCDSRERPAPKIT